MKNTVSINRQPETVSPQEVVDALRHGCEYTQDEICDALPGRPRTAVRATINTMVERGMIWRAASHSRVKFSLLEGDALRKAVDSKTIRSETPAWMKANLNGYEAEQARFRELCMQTRK